MNKLIIHYKRHDKYGPTFKFQIFSLIFVFTSDRDAIKEILIIKNYPKTKFLMSRVMHPYNERYLGYGLVTGNRNIFLNFEFFNNKPFIIKI